MPIYEYACKACGHRVEVLHGIHATGPATCDVCGGPMTKLLSAPAIVFKGSGWAKKDARDRSAARTSTDGKKPDAGAAEPAAAGTGSTAGGSSGTESSGEAKSLSASTQGTGATRGGEREAHSSGRNASGAAASPSRKSGDR